MQQSCEIQDVIADLLQFAPSWRKVERNG